MCVADAFCPRLGSHLGPETGGVIRAGNLVCPFHGFEFDVTGRYMTTPHAPPPKSARLKAYPMQEVNGFVFAYWDHAGRAPTWSIPDLASDGRSGRALKRLRLRTHPQVTGSEATGPDHHRRALSCFVLLVHQTHADAWAAQGALRDIKISVWGLGMSVVHMHSPATGLKALQWVLAAPIDGEVIDLWLAVDPRGRLRLPLVGPLPKWVSHGLAPRIMLHELELDVMKDAVIWARHRYEPMPVLSKGDHDVYRFRRYSEQFYPPAGLTFSG